MCCSPEPCRPAAWPHALCCQSQTILNQLDACVQVAALAGSPSAAAAKDILEAADNSWRELQPLVAEAEQEGSFPTGEHHACVSLGSGTFYARI